MKGLPHGATWVYAYDHAETPTEVFPDVDATCEASIVCTGAPIGVSSDEGCFHPFVALNNVDDLETAPPVRVCEDCASWLEDVYTTRET